MYHTGSSFNEVAQLTKDQETQVKKIYYENNWSNRTQVKLIRMAKTIADLDEKIDMSNEALVETTK